MKLEGKRTSPAEYEKYAGREIKIKMQLCVELLLGPPSRMWEKERRGAVSARARIRCRASDSRRPTKTRRRTVRRATEAK